MRQSTASRVSQSLQEWRASEPIHIFEFPFGPSTKQAPGKGHKKRPETRFVEEAIGEITREQMIVSRRLEGKRLGCRIILVVNQPTNDLDNVCKVLWDGMKGIAVKDDKLFDYLEEVRERAIDDESECIVVEIFERVEMRQSPWM